MRHGSLCSGIGGFDLAASWLGWTNTVQVEIDPWCRKILAKHFPQTARHSDIKEFDGIQYRGQIDILTAGYPCQPFSIAGKRKGTADPRHLWPDVYRVIQEIQPRYVVAENVAGHVSKGLEQVCDDLESAGYGVWPFLIPALSVGATHIRARVWIVAYSDSVRCTPHVSEGAEVEGIPSSRGLRGGAMSVWESEAPPLTDCHRVANGIPAGMDCEDPQHDRLERIKGLGNAIVPQVAYYLLRAIEAHDWTTRMIEVDR